MTLKADYGDLKDEVHKMKKRIAALERAFDAIATTDDLRADEEAKDDLRKGRTLPLAESKKKALEV